MVALGIGPQASNRVVVVTGVISFADADLDPQAAAISQSRTISSLAPGLPAVDPAGGDRPATWASGA